MFAELAFIQEWAGNHMLQKIVNKLINPYLITKTQRVGFLLSMLALVACIGLFIYLDEYEDSIALIIALGTLILGLYLMYFKNRVDAFVNGSKGIDVGLNAGTQAHFISILKSNITHYILIFLIAFSYSVYVEIWLGNFILGKHKFDIFIAGILGATLVLAGIPILVGRYVSIWFAYVALIIMLFFNFFGAQEEKSINEANAVKIESMEKVVSLLGNLHKQCAIRESLAQGACKGRLTNSVSNQGNEIICDGDLTTLFPASISDWVNSVIKSPNLIQAIQIEAANYERLISSGSYAKTTSKDLATIMGEGSINKKVTSDSRYFDVEQIAKIVDIKKSLLNSIKLIPRD
jgi:hypothetical protein